MNSTVISYPIIPGVQINQFIPPLEVSNALGGVASVPDGWVYTGGSRAPEALPWCTFSCCLTREQIAIISERAYNMISGHYATWQQFCAAHGIIEQR